MIRGVCGLGESGDGRLVVPWIFVDLWRLRQRPRGRPKVSLETGRERGFESDGCGEEEAGIVGDFRDVM